jgi:hypothetical protein
MCDLIMSILTKFHLIRNFKLLITILYDMLCFHLIHNPDIFHRNVCTLITLPKSTHADNIILVMKMLFLWLLFNMFRAP